MDKMMNAPVNVEQELMPVSISKSKTELDRKRYLWAISPALPAIGIGILAGYQFAPRPRRSARLRARYLHCPTQRPASDKEGPIPRASSQISGVFLIFWVLRYLKIKKINLILKIESLILHL